MSVIINRNEYQENTRTYEASRHCIIITHDHKSVNVPLLILTVHNALTGLVSLLGIAKDIRLAKEGINESRLSVIDVRDNGDVAA